MLYQLKRAGVNQADLVTVYISVVRPVVGYAGHVWHTNLPIYLSDNIEMIQKRSVKAIFPGMSYVDILNHINLSTLQERRDYICTKYFINMQAGSHKVNCLLPEKRHVDYDLRRANVHPLPVTRTHRYNYSFTSWLPGFARAPSSLPASLSLSPSLSPPSRPPLPLSILGLPGFAIVQDNCIPEILFLKLDASSFWPKQNVNKNVSIFSAVHEISRTFKMMTP